MFGRNGERITGKNVLKATTAAFVAGLAATALSGCAGDAEAKSPETTTYTKSAEELADEAASKLQEKYQKYINMNSEEFVNYGLDVRDDGTTVMNQAKMNELRSYVLYRDSMPVDGANDHCDRESGNWVFEQTSEYNPLTRKASMNDSTTDIEKYLNFQDIVSNSQCTDGDVVGGITQNPSFNTEESLKVYSAGMLYDMGTGAQSSRTYASFDAYKKITTIALGKGTRSFPRAKLPRERISTSISEPLHGTDNNGNPINYKVSQYNHKDGYTTYVMYALIQEGIKGPDGQNVPMWVLFDQSEGKPFYDDSGNPIPLTPEQ